MAHKQGHNDDELLTDAAIVTLGNKVSELARENERLTAQLAAQEADAKRMQWILDGNGYFMEENGICGYIPDYQYSEEEKNAARRSIDEAMAWQESEEQKGSHD